LHSGFCAQLLAVAVTGPRSGACPTALCTKCRGPRIIREKAQFSHGATATSTGDPWLAVESSGIIDAVDTEDNSVHIFYIRNDEGMRTLRTELGQVKLSL
jgi:hypothetical protein